MHTAPLEIEKFDGDPTKYTAFVQRFKDVVEANTDSDSVKLGQLIQNCTTKVADNIRSYMHKAPAEGYKGALAKLKLKYGRSSLICQGWISKLLAQTNLADEENLAKFATEIRKLPRNPG